MIKDLGLSLVYKQGRQRTSDIGVIPLSFLSLNFPFLSLLPSLLL